MPTGYTSSIEKGISFKEFILDCARAFGACITMRDEAKGKPIPEEFKPSDYHSDKIKGSEKGLRDLRKITLKQAAKKGKEEYEKELKSSEAYINKCNVLRQKYEDMLNEVRAWTPPTKEHTGLKDFMVKQLEQSIEFDCKTGYWVEKHKEIKLLSGQDWLDKERKVLVRDLNYHTKEDIEEKSRVAGRNTWIRKLRESI